MFSFVKVSKEPWHFSFLTDDKKIDDDNVSELEYSTYITTKIAMRRNTKSYDGYAYCLFYGREEKPVYIGFSRDKSRSNIWKGSFLVKTLYMHDATNGHINIIRLLQYCDKIGILKNIYDEGGYWDCQDFTKLIDKMHKELKLITAFNRSIKSDMEVSGSGVHSDLRLKEYLDL
jgi:hypothetical protein